MFAGGDAEPRRVLGENRRVGGGRGGLTRPRRRRRGHAPSRPPPATCMPTDEAGTAARRSLCAATSIDVVSSRQRARGLGARRPASSADAGGVVHVDALRVRGRIETRHDPGSPWSRRRRPWKPQFRTEPRTGADLGERRPVQGVDPHLVGVQREPRSRLPMSTEAGAVRSDRRTLRQYVVGLRRSTAPSRWVAVVARPRCSAAVARFGVRRHRVRQLEPHVRHRRPGPTQRARDARRRWRYDRSTSRTACRRYPDASCYERRRRTREGS